MSPDSFPTPGLLPREKMLRHGEEALSDAELLALLLRTGLAGQGVLDFAHSLLTRFGGLDALIRASPAELQSIKGLGPARSCELRAVLALSRRVLFQGLRETPVMNDVQRVKDYLSLQLADLGHEVFAVLFLDNQHRLLEMTTLFRGSLAQTSVHPREVVKEALARNSAAVVLSHNHPSGCAEPSPSDRQLTQMLQSALKLVDVRVLDHVVIGRGEAVSFAERGWL